ncbi:MAG TPA: YqgE/AlgH family protein [Acidimicrobiales bacterium]|nr:YqgE/AlgH family protein [Acidimicrobiales bacterium]
MPGPSFESSPPGSGVTGRLLVASTRLGDPNFERAVVLVLDHGDDGALGVVLNRPTHVPVGEILEPWRDQAEMVPPAVVFRGGPVSPDAVIGLARAASAETASAAAWRVVIPTVGTVDLSVPPERQPLELQGARLFWGYSGWAPDQLEAELVEGAWFVLDAVAADVFGAEAERLWHDVMRRQGGELSLLATYPSHPSLN